MKFGFRCAFLLCAFAAAALAADTKPAAESKSVTVKGFWEGLAKYELRTLVPASGAITDQTAFDALWKAWGTGRTSATDQPAAPTVDFEKDLVVVVLGGTPGNRGERVRVVDSVTLDEKGDLQVATNGDAIGGTGFGYGFVQVPKEGIKSIGGKALVAAAGQKVAASATAPAKEEIVKTGLLKVKQTWVGVMPAAMETLVGAVSGAARAADHVIVDDERLALIWKRWGMAGDMPAVDFAKEMLLISCSKGPNKPGDVKLDEKGDVSIVGNDLHLIGTPAMEIKMGDPGWGYALLLVDRAGIKSVDGLVIKFPAAPVTATGPKAAVATIGAKTLSFKLAVSGSTNSPVRKSETLEVSAQEVTYKTQGTPMKSYVFYAMRNPVALTNVIVPPADFYIAASSDMIAVSSLFGSISLSKSYSAVPESTGDIKKTIGQFSDLLDDKTIESKTNNKASVSLKAAANYEFFTANSAGGSQLASATISGFDVTDDVLRLDLLSPGGKFKGSFWIDLKASKVLRSMIDGQEMDITGNKGFAVPATATAPATPKATGGGY